MPINGSGDSHRTDPFRDRVVVVTGASAGVGRATARAFARAGAKVALLARDEQALQRTCAELQSVGGIALGIPVDVADSSAVFSAADRCERELGPIEVWVNNAMATTFSAVENLEPEEIRRITEVAYLGFAYGTMAALRHMRGRDRGVIVQVGSSLAYRGIPLQAAYCAAKHAIRGFTDSVRCELLHAGSAIRLTTVHLPAINTPQFDWARTHRGNLPRPLPPVYRPQIAAQAILHAARRPAREYWLGGMTPLMILANMLAPGLLDRYIATRVTEGQDTGDPLPVGRRDNLFTPVTGMHRTDGRFSSESRRSAMLINASVARVAATASACLLAGAIGYALGSPGSSRTPRRQHRGAGPWKRPRGGYLR